MASQKLVRCTIHHPRDPADDSTRYVPLEIFGLWEFLMTQRHGFRVHEARASLWLDAEEAPESTYDEHQLDRVTEISVFLYSGRDDMFTRVCRYFPSSDCGALKRIFLAHYPQEASRIQPHVRERAGIWIHREIPA
ncbi:MAG: hypothetical protein E6K80_07965 [Candidatus Eisenbacteria bacterium]|uniref:Uncharacterized protein n=1 Tax=Eiseniibacteriota bacterium TaxID=2212470 RepID=A0A538U3Y8_UNCEI|nr:MAG: hypothetical protein E6K80_07965 [Candidatus Eisenbacteria bacterium]